MSKCVLEIVDLGILLKVVLLDLLIFVPCVILLALHSTGKSFNVLNSL